MTLFGIVPAHSNSNAALPESQFIIPDSLISSDTLIPITQPFKLSESERWPANSVLKEGKWFVIAVKDDGVFKITIDLIKEWGLDPSQINPNSISIWYRIPILKKKTIPI